MKRVRSRRSRSAFKFRSARGQRQVSRDVLACALAEELRHGADGVAYLHAACLLRRLGEIDPSIFDTFESLLCRLDED